MTLQRNQLLEDIARARDHLDTIEAYWKRLVDLQASTAGSVAAMGLPLELLDHLLNKELDLETELEYYEERALAQMD